MMTVTCKCGTFITLLGRYRIGEILKVPGPYTVFAPTDERLTLPGNFKFLLQ